MKNRGKTILTKEGVIKITAELEHIEKVSLPDAEKNYKYWESTGDEICTKEAQEMLDFYKGRVPYLKNMLETAKVT